ncbi:MAG: hypothetical protein R3C26_24805 [Calditrichia bacterium]
MEKKELSAREFTQFEDRFQIFLLIALIIFALEMFISERRSHQRLMAEPANRLWENWF